MYVAGFGANGDVVDRANQMSKRWGGRLTFLSATVQSALNYQAPEARLTWEGPDGPGEWEGQMLSCTVANGAYCGRTSPRPRPTPLLLAFTGHGRVLVTGAYPMPILRIPVYLGSSR